MFLLFVKKKHISKKLVFEKESEKQKQKQYQTAPRVTISFSYFEMASKHNL